ncbi:hypothetical protein C0J52_18750 [Blattella germanica]|nr:hypothetical protein C0J52_18750 [Blattella germanica]
MWYLLIICFFSCVLFGFGSPSIDEITTQMKENIKDTKEPFRLISADEFDPMKTSSAVNEIPNDVLVEQIKALSKHFNSQQRLVKRQNGSQKANKPIPPDELNVVVMQMADRSKRDTANHPTEKKELVHHVFGPLSVTTADDVDIPVKFLQTRSVSNQTSNDALVEQIKALSSYINSQQGLARRKRQAGGPSDKLTVVNLEGNIKDVNLGPLRVKSNQGS